MTSEWYHVLSIWVKITVCGDSRQKYSSMIDIHVFHSNILMREHYLFKYYLSLKNDLWSVDLSNKLEVFSMWNHLPHKNTWHILQHSSLLSQGNNKLQTTRGNWPTVFYGGALPKKMYNSKESICSCTLNLINFIVRHFLVC